MEFEKLLAEIERLDGLRRELLEKLKRSRALQSLWPTVHFPTYSVWAGSPSRGFVLEIRDALGDRRTFRPEELPEILRESMPAESHLYRTRRAPTSEEIESAKEAARKRRRYNT